MLGEALFYHDDNAPSLCRRVQGPYKEWNAANFNLDWNVTN